MNHRMRKLVAGLAIVAGAMSVPSMAFAQEDILTKKIPSLEYQQADVREALKALFKQVDASYSLAPDIVGYVTVTLKDVSFEIALTNLLNQVDATYRYEAGVFVIVKREPPLPPDTGNREGDTTAPTAKKIFRRHRIRSADPMLIAMLIGTNNGSQQWFGNPYPSILNMGGGMGMGGMGGGMMGGGMGGMGMGGMGMGGMGMGGMGGGMGGGMMGGGMGRHGHGRHGHGRHGRRRHGHGRLLIAKRF